MKGYTLLLLFGLLTIGHSSQAQYQDHREVSSITDWLEEINNWPDSIYVQEKIIINIDDVKDSLYVENPDNDDWRSDPVDNIPKFQVNKEVRLFDVGFWSDHRYSGDVLKNIAFKDLHITGLYDNRLGFKNVTFDYLQIRRIGTSFWLAFVDCVIGRMNNNNQETNTPFSFIRTRIERDSYFSSIETPLTINMDGCTIGSTLLFAQGTPITGLNISNSVFHGGLGLEGTSIANRFELYDSEIRYLDVNGAELPLLNTYVPFKNVSNSLCLDLSETVTLGGINEDKSPLYWGTSREELLDQTQFDKLIASYSKLLSIYKGRSEMKSYNACYIEMRDKMTAQSKLLYDLDPTFSNYFAYQINRFTRAFSDYGTRPEKAIIIFFQVVLGFSIFYFFFPSSWNTTNNRKLMKRLSYLGSYFKSKEGLSDLFEKETKDQYRDYEEFKEFIDSSEKELPVYFKWLSKPLYTASVSKFNVTRSVLRRTDILDGKWSDLPKAKRAGTSMVIGIYLVFYLLYVLIVRILNAITLSLNAFSTLGFGEIPTKGLARYVTIIQGFVGWFLLSIFLVSLIGQILN